MEQGFKKVRLCSLWEKEMTSAKGENYTLISGTLGDCWVNMEKNKFKKEGDNQPTWNLYLSPKLKKGVSAEAPTEKSVDDIKF